MRGRRSGQPESKNRTTNTEIQPATINSQRRTELRPATANGVEAGPSLAPYRWCLDQVFSFNVTNRLVEGGDGNSELTDDHAVQHDALVLLKVKPLFSAEAVLLEFIA